MLSTSWLHFVYMTVQLSQNYLSWVYIEVIAEATLSKAALHQRDSCLDVCLGPLFIQQKEEKSLN